MQCHKYLCKVQGALKPDLINTSDPQQLFHRVVTFAYKTGQRERKIDFILSKTEKVWRRELGLISKKKSTCI